jgi:DNA replication protein DnaC
MSIAYEQLAAEALDQIGAATALAQLDSVAQQAAAASWSYTHFLGRLLQPELAARKARVIETNLRFAALPYLKRLADFDFAFQPSLDKTLIEELATGSTSLPPSNSPASWRPPTPRTASPMCSKPSPSPGC